MTIGTFSTSIQHINTILLTLKMSHSSLSVVPHKTVIGPSISYSFATTGVLESVVIRQCNYHLIKEKGILIDLI